MYSFRIIKNAYGSVEGEVINYNKGLLRNLIKVN